MLARVCIALLGALILALPITAGFAITNPDPVARAKITGTPVSGEAFLQRRLARNESHVTLRLTGLRSRMQYTWDIRGGTSCGGSTGSPLLTPTAPLTVSSLGQAMVATTFPTTVTVAAPGTPQTGIAIRVYGTVAGVTTEVACAGFVGQPDTGTSHWW